MGIHHDMQLLDWQHSVESGNFKKGYTIVGDNIDKRVVPREMRLENQVEFALFPCIWCSKPH